MENGEDDLMALKFARNLLLPLGTLTSLASQRRSISVILGRTDQKYLLVSIMSIKISRCSLFTALSRIKL